MPENTAEHDHVDAERDEMNRTDKGAHKKECADKGILFRLSEPAELFLVRLPSSESHGFETETCGSAIDQ